MKNYKEMAESVFERRDKYNAERKISVSRLKKSLIGVVCCFSVALLGFGIWQARKPESFPDMSESFPITSESSENPETQKDKADMTIDRTETEINTISWMSADEVLKSSENGDKMGVSVPMLIAYQGAIYGITGEKDTENSRYALLDDEVIFRKDYAYPAYEIKDTSDCVAIIINGRLTAYQRLFEVTAVIDGTAYEIIHPMGFGSTYTYGEIIQENENFTVYHAIDTQSGKVIESEYVINILPLLKIELPNFFDGDENYGDAWWVALPQSDG